MYQEATASFLRFVFESICKSPTGECGADVVAGCCLRNLTLLYILRDTLETVITQLTFVSI